MSVSVTQETIGPKRAEELLAMNKRNRGIHTVTLEAMIRDITNNKWVFNGESIKISDEGVLIDGQHRLQAVIQANKPIETVIVRGLREDAARATIDVGARRTFNDLLKIHGEPNASAIGATVRGDWYLAKFGNPRRFGVMATNHDLWEHWLTDEEGFRIAGRLGDQASHSVLRLAASVSGPIYHQQVLINRAKADEFWGLLLNNDAPKGNAIWALRETLLRDLVRPGRVDYTTRMAYVVKAWNAWLQGKEKQFISWRSAGRGAEGFPKLMTPDSPAMPDDDEEVA